MIRVGIRMGVGEDRRWLLCMLLLAMRMMRDGLLEGLGRHIA
jgi:hypothetical protein